ncbi:phosphotransferase enzyme family protein [Cesiribacter sp. SM1]|uniref:phosphotransferase enzyme family protein n=1 Tax=Cesiribacter sp. SM1 TaxID=2861196 RepID=UPI001CD6074A|nr:phosphotransferase [Cesiribacter sp. SM1]
MSQIFPTAYSTFCTTALAGLVSENYGLSEAGCKMLLRGVGDTYLIQAAEGRFILRVYRSSHRNYAQIKAETELLMALKEARVAVSYPITDLAGNQIQRIQAAEGERHAVLFTYAPGKAYTVLNDKQLGELGRQMARFHDVSSAIDLGNSRWCFNLETTLFKPLAGLKPFFAEDPETYEWLCGAASRVQHKLSTLNTAAFSAGYCHFDFMPKNFHFDGDKVTLFDFDFFGHGWLINDVMTFRQHLCLEVHYGKAVQEEADKAYSTFLEGYREYRSLSEDELAAVPYLGLGFWLFYLHFYTTHDQFYPLLQPLQLKARTALIRQLMERYWKD